MSQVANTSLPTWLMVAIFLIILTLLALSGSLFVFILGAILETLVFAAGYNASKGKH